MSGAILLEYRMDEQVSLEGPGPRHLESWAISVFDSPPGDSRAEIGSVHVVVINLEEGDDVRDLTDDAAGVWRDRVGEVRPGPASHLLLLDRVWVRPDHRGDGLGPIIAAAVIERLGRGCDLAACYPAPFEGPCEPADHDASVAALGRIWSQVGFRHWGNGVWMLDPKHHDTRAATAALVVARAAARR